MTAPYYPALLGTPVVNPRVGGFIRPLPYLSLSQYRYAPTAMDTDSLVTRLFGGGEPTEQDQEQALYNVIWRASGEIDRYVYGVAEASKGASLCASQSVEDLAVKPLMGFLNLQCDYWPILQLDGLEVGAAPGQTAAVAQSVASQARFGKRTIKVPALYPPYTTAGPQLAVNNYGPDGKVYCLWTYTAGFPHLELAADAAAGQKLVSVVANGPSGTLLGVYPGSNFTIEDYSNTETFVVQSVSGALITATSNLLYTHTVPAAPDFTPVTAMHGDVQQAAIFMVTALIKTRGDASLTLQGMSEPEAKEGSPADALAQDLDEARRLLDPFRVVTKQRS